MANVLLYLEDFVEEPLKVKEVTFKPTGSNVRVDGDYIVTSDYRSKYTNGIGYIYWENILTGYYGVKIHGPTKNTEFSILVPDDTGSYNAKDLLADVTGSITNTFYITASNALFANSASYVISASYAQTSSIIVYNGNRTIKRSPYTTLNVGGDDLLEFVDNFFFPFVPATVAITDASTIYYETGSSQNSSIISTITVNDETSFGSASVKRNNVTWNTTISPAPASFTYTDTGISSSYSYVTYVQVDNDGSPTIINSTTKATSFIFPYLWGMSATAGLSGNDLYTAFTRQIVTSGNKTVSMIGNVVYLYFAYPTSYPALTSILDPNLFQVISSFEYSASVPVVSSGLTNTWTANYRVYRTTLVSDPTGDFQFKQ